jgi:flagellar hook-associated protein 2
MAVTASTSTALDVPALVSQLMSLERRPVDKLNAKVTDYQAKISSFGTLSGLVSGFQSALGDLKSSLQAYSTTASDARVFSATAASTAVAGTYSVVVSQLAQAQNLVAVGQASDTSAISTAASTVTFTVGGAGTDVAIAAGATLQNIRDAINSADIGVVATIVNDGTAAPYRLALASKDTGLNHGISNIAVSGGGAALGDLLAYESSSPASSTLTQTVAAQNASLTVNGIPITSASNSLTGAIQGVNLTLKSITTTPATLTVERDTNAISTAAGKVVETYSALVSQLKSRSAYGNATTAAPVLAGDSTVRQMQDQLRGILMSPTSGGTMTYLAQVGISSQADGTLKLDSSKLSSAMASDFSDVANLFSSTTGFATRLDAWATSVLQSGGLIDSRTKGLNQSIQAFNTQISSLERRMAVLQKQYTTTYSNLNMFLANMNSTSTYLTSQFSKSSSS